MSPRRVLCVCQGGNVRSVALATRLKQKYRVDALACGVEKNSAETLTMLCEWADVIVPMSEPVSVCIPGQFARKMHICDVGPDRFGSPAHLELVDLAKRHAADVVKTFGDVK